MKPNFDELTNHLHNKSKLEIKTYLENMYNLGYADGLFGTWYVEQDADKEWLESHNVGGLTSED